MSQDIINSVVNLVFSSKRQMPAHFCSFGNRKQSFGIDFDELNAHDDYEIASQAWSGLSEYIKNNISSIKRAYIVKLGEDTMLAAYITTKLSHSELVSSVTQAIQKINLELIDKKVENINKISGVKEYLDFCQSHGSNLAEK